MRQKLFDAQQEPLGALEVGDAIEIGPFATGTNLGFYLKGPGHDSDQTTLNTTEEARKFVAFHDETGDKV